MVLAVALLLVAVSSGAFAQTHVTQPFHYFWDEQTSSVTGAAGVAQVNHFELQVDAGAPLNVAIPAGSAPSAVLGNTTYKVLADPALPVGAHTFVVYSCSGSALGVGCVVAVPFPFVLDSPIPPVPAKATNLGVGPVRHGRQLKKIAKD